VSVASGELHAHRFSGNATARPVVSPLPRRVTADTVLASIIVFLLPLQTVHVFSRSFDVGVMLAVIFAPLLVPVAFLSRLTARLFVLLISTACFGMFLAEFSLGGNRTVNRAYELGIIGLLVAGALAVAAFTWARGLLSVQAIAILYGAGAIVDGLVSPELWQGNPWKYTFGWPIAICALAAVARRGRTVQLVVLAALGALAAAYQDRSFVGFCLVCALLVVIGLGRSHQGAPKTPAQIARALALLAIVAFGVYQGGTHLALSGALGRGTQVRTEVNITSGQPLIAAGRPESAAAFALARERPIGFGPGVTPNPDEQRAATRALIHRGVDPGTAYVKDYMFGGHVEVHSIVGDLWVGFGFFGLWVAGFLVFWIVKWLAHYLSSSALLLPFIAVATLWDVAFSPLPSAFLKAVLAFCLLVPAEVLTRGRRLQSRGVGQ
jgi:hypothetical protein